MFFLIISILALIICVSSAVEATISFVKREKSLGTKFILIAIIALLLSVGMFCGGKLTKLAPDEVGVNYASDGTVTTLKTGYNVIPIVSITNKLSAKATVVTFSEGEGTDNIFGAQTSEKDYISAVATVSVRLDPTKLDTYISMYGTEQISSDTVIRLLKTTARTAIENVIGSYTTSDVMSNKAKINAEAATEFRKCMENQPIIIDSFTIDDLVAPTSYEEAIKAQAELRQQTQTAELQAELNAKEAEANKIKAEGEAAVAKTNAENEATVAQIQAENEKKVAELNAEKDASVAKTKAESDAEVIKIASEAEAQKTLTVANAEAEALIKSGNAEAEVAAALAKVYKDNPQMYELEEQKISAEVAKAWAEKWAGINLDGISTISWADVSEILNNIVGNALPGTN